ncbi:dynein axonemal heavy chain 9-like [Amia ocellicauda]|uniref:dynein axonemal heavy chain 9-like n=1 Tax=Amia ocellicauda TaxID=2972642 RepID=UPI0034639104
MTLGDLLTLGLQKHADNVKTIVERAVKDVALESGLKNCEEVWLSRIFDLRPHCTMTSDGTGRQAETVTLVTNAEAIFEELEHHQMALESMKDKSEAGSFADEVTKWQRKLQIIEVIVRLLLEVQDKWTDLEQVLTCDAVRGDLPTEAATFAAVHRDLCSVMNAAEENPNVLQICTRGGLQDTLRDMKERLDRCQCALLCYLETRRSAFPRFFFLPLEDTLKIICCACNPAELHRYLYKVFEHMGSLIFERNNEIHEARSQRIVAVKSSAGEQLCLTEPLDCGGPAERWLELLVGRIRSALQRDLHRSLGHTLRPLREIHSAGARRVAVSRPTSHAQQDGERDGGSSGGSRRAAVPRGSEGSAVVSSAKSGRPTWILGAPSQAIHLATQIQFTRSLERHLTDLEKGQQGALQLK